MSRPAITPADLIGNAVVIIGVCIAGAWLLDGLWSYLGWKPWMVCSAMALMQATIGQAFSMIIICLGLVLFFLTGMRNGGYLVLVIGGVILSQFPGVFAHYLGASCS